MAATFPNTGTGTTIAFSSGFFAQIRDIRHSGVSRPSIKTSHMGTTTNDTFIPGDLTDNGTYDIDMSFNPAVAPPDTAVTSSCVITFPGTAVNVATFDAFVIGVSQSIPFEDLMTATVTLKVTGAITLT